MEPPLLAAEIRWASGVLLAGDSAEDTLEYATCHWLTTAQPVLDYANTMVPLHPVSASDLEEGWEEHVRGKPLIPPLAPAKLTGSLYTVAGGHVLPECNDWSPFSRKRHWLICPDRAAAWCRKDQRDARLHVLGG